MLGFRRLDIDVFDVAERLAVAAGRPITDVEAMVWLRRAGMVMHGDSWVGDESSLAELQELPAAGLSASDSSVIS